MHWLGLLSHSNAASSGRAAALAPLTGPVRSFVTLAILVTVFAQAVFLFNFLWSLFRGERVVDMNPWHATTLEWNAASPADDMGARGPVVYRGAYEFSVPGLAEDFVPQHLAPEQVAKAR